MPDSDTRGPVGQHVWPRYRRNLDGAWSAIDDLQEAMGGMMLADEIADEVARRVRQGRTNVLTRGQRLIGALAAIAVIATGVHTWVA